MARVLHVEKAGRAGERRPFRPANALDDRGRAAQPLGILAVAHEDDRARADLAEPLGLRRPGVRAAARATRPRRVPGRRWSGGARRALPARARRRRPATGAISPRSPPAASARTPREGRAGPRASRLSTESPRAWARGARGRACGPGSRARTGSRPRRRRRGRGDAPSPSRTSRGGTPSPPLRPRATAVRARRSSARGPVDRNAARESPRRPRWPAPRGDPRPRTSRAGAGPSRPRRRPRSRSGARRDSRTASARLRPARPLRRGRRRGVRGGASGASAGAAEDGGEGSGGSSPKPPWRHLEPERLARPEIGGEEGDGGFGRRFCRVKRRGEGARRRRGFLRRRVGLRRPARAPWARFGARRGRRARPGGARRLGSFTFEGIFGAEGAVFSSPSALGAEAPRRAAKSASSAILHGDLHPDEALDRVEREHVVLVRERDRLARLAGARRASDPVDVVLGVLGKVHVDDVRDAVDVEPARRDVRRHEQRQRAALEVLEDLEAPRLRDVSGERADAEAVPLEVRDESLGEALRVHEEHRALDALASQEVEQERDLLALRDVVEHLRDAVGGDLLGPDLDLPRVVHVLVRQLHHAKRERGREEHRVPAAGRRAAAEDAPQVLDEAEVEQAVRLVDDERLDLAERRRALLLVVEEAPRRSDEEVAAGAELVALAAVVDAAEDGHDAHLQEVPERARILLDLHGQLARGRDDERARVAGRLVALRPHEAREDRDEVRGRLPGARSGPGRRRPDRRGEGEASPPGWASPGRIRTRRCPRSPRAGASGRRSRRRKGGPRISPRERSSAVIVASGSVPVASDILISTRAFPSMTPLADRRPVLFALGIAATRDRVHDGRARLRPRHRRADHDPHGLRDVRSRRDRDRARPPGRHFARPRETPSRGTGWARRSSAFRSRRSRAPSRTLSVWARRRRSSSSSRSCSSSSRRPRRAFSPAPWARERRARAAPASPPRSPRLCGRTRGPTGPSRSRRRASAARSRARLSPRGRASSRAGRPPSRRSPEAAAGFALLSKSILIVLFPCVLAVLWFGSERSARARRSLAACAGWLTPAARLARLRDRALRAPVRLVFGRALQPSGARRALAPHGGPEQGALPVFPARASRRARSRAARARSGALSPLALSGFSLFVLVTTAAWWSWDGTSGWGPRLLVPLVPLLAGLAVVGAAAMPPLVFRVLFGIGVLVNAARGAAARRRPRVVLRDPQAEAAVAGASAPASRRSRPKSIRRLRAPSLLPIHDAAMHAGLSPLRVNAWLLMTRLGGGDVHAALAKPPWRTDVKGQEVAAPPERVIPASALVFLTSPFRWPHLGMSLTRRGDETDTVLSFIDCLYDQELRAQDMRRPDRAIEFGEELYRRVPSPQTITALAEAYRLAGKRETLRDFVRSLPPAQRGRPGFRDGARPRGARLGERGARARDPRTGAAGGWRGRSTRASRPCRSPNGPRRCARRSARPRARRAKSPGDRMGPMSVTVEVPKIESPDAATLRVTCPATGELAGEVPDLDAAGVAAAVARSRAAAPSLGRGVARGADRGAPEVARSRPRHAARARDSRERERQAAARGRGDRGSLPLRADSGDDEALAPRARRRDPTPAPFPHEEDAPRAAPARRRRRHRSLEFPDPEQRGRCRRAAPGRQRGRAQALRGHAPDVVRPARPLGERGESAGRLPGRHRAGRGGGRARGPRGRRHVHRLRRDGPEDRRALRRAADPVRDRAGRQVAVRRPPGRGPRAGGRGRGVVELHPFGPGVHPHGAHLRARVRRGPLRAAPRVARRGAPPDGAGSVREARTTSAP